MGCSLPGSSVHGGQAYWSGLLVPSPGHLLNPGTELWSPAMLADSLWFEPLLLLLLLLLSHFSRVRPILCDPIDNSPPDSAVPGILQARTLEWVAISFSNASK